TQIWCIFRPVRGLAFQTCKLGKASGTPVFSDAEFGSADDRPTAVIASERSIRHPIIVIRVAPIHKGLVIRYDGSPLTYWNVFGILKTEATCIPRGTCLLTIVFREPGLTGIFHHDQIVPGGDFHDRIHVT